MFLNKLCDFRVSRKNRSVMSQLEAWLTRASVGPAPGNIQVCRLKTQIFQTDWCYAASVLRRRIKFVPLD